MTGELTPEQVAELESFERNTQLEPDILLYFARRDAAGNLRHTVEFGHINAPPDAEGYAGWKCDDVDADGWSRDFWGEAAQPGDANAVVFVVGRQFDDGRCERGVVITGSGTGWLTADQAREVARLMNDAADRIDELGD